MQAQGIVEFSSTRANPDVDPALHIWGWEVPVYLFLGGLVAGLLVLHALVVLTRKQERMPASYGLAPLFAVPLLGLGLGALFLDLEYKLHVLQFYTAFRLGSPMSWGSWVLLLVFGTGGLAALAALGRLPGSAAAPWGRIGLVRSLAAFGQRHEALVARANLFLGLVLGVYTGVLLSSFAARPFWNSALLGPLCLVSGASAGIALAALLARDPQERHTLVRVDLLLLLVEAALVLLWLNGMANAGEAGRDAAQLVLGGSHTAVFWLLFVTVGLVVPFLLEFMALRHRWAETLVAPVLVLIGGIVFRFVLVDAGQLSAFGG
jgi:protein NrfD